MLSLENIYLSVHLLYFHQVLDDSLDDDPLDSFYYVKWDDSIYDQFDDFGQVLTPAEAATEAESEAEAGAGEPQRSSIRVTYSDHHPSRPQPEEVTCYLVLLSSG